MGLRHVFRESFGGGGGNHVGPSSFTFGSGPFDHPAPVAGDLLIITAWAQYGLFGAASQPSFFVTDDASNVWINVGNTFDGSGNLGDAYNGQWIISTWVCLAHTGNPITNITIDSSSVPNAFNFQGQVGYSDWDFSGFTATYFDNETGLISTNDPTISFVSPSGSKVAIASFFAGLASGIEGGTFAPGYTQLSPFGSLNYVDEYILNPAGAQSPDYMTPASASYPHWLMSVIAVAAAGTLAITPTILSIEGPEFNAGPFSKNIAISTSVTDTAWSITSDADWLTAGTSSGTDAATVAVNANASGLISGTYIGHLTITSPTATNSPIVVTVTFTVTCVYLAAGGFSSTALEHKSDSSPDNLEITHFLEADVISEFDLKSGLYDFAAIELRVVSWEHPENGSVKQLKGTLGQVSIKNGLAATELRGLTQKLSTNICSTFGPTCRAELFDGKISSSDNPADQGMPWRCRKDPTAYTATRSVASSPDAITIVPNTALPTPAFTANQGTAITLNGQAVTAKFYNHQHGSNGAFELAFGGTVGNPIYFGGVTHPSVQASGSGNSINFNGGTEYSSVPVISPLNWAVIDNGGHVLSWGQPWLDATENYDMIVYGQMNIPAAGNYTFNVAHDDGCMFAMIPNINHPNDVVTVVSGPVCPPLNQPTNPLNQTLTAYNGYSFGQYHDYIGGTGDHGSGSRYVACNNKQGNNVDQWTLHFPAAGVYLFEFGWTNFEHRQRLWVTVQGQANDILPSNIGSGTSPVSGWYENGLVRFTSGALKDWTFDIQELDGSGNIKLFAGNPMPIAPQAGDTFIVQTGCNKLTSDCFYKYGNVVNFQGENAMPGNFVLLQTPDLK